MKLKLEVIKEKTIKVEVYGALIDVPARYMGTTLRLSACEGGRVADVDIVDHQCKNNLLRANVARLAVRVPGGSRMSGRWEVYHPVADILVIAPGDEFANMQGKTMRVVQVYPAYPDASDCTTRMIAFMDAQGRSYCLQKFEFLEEFPRASGS